MNKGEKLEVIIQKAIDGGWKPRFPHYTVYLPRLNWIKFNNGLAQYESMEPYSLIFNHDFAKALWGEEEVDNHG